MDSKDVPNEPTVGLMPKELDYEVFYPAKPRKNTCAMHFELAHSLSKTTMCDQLLALYTVGGVTAISNFGLLLTGLDSC